MSDVLFNPTNETLKAQHQGVDVILAPYPESGHILKVDSARARHILNILSPRGLTTLEYGDDRDDGAKKKAKAESGRERNKAFKRKCVIDFNQLNQGNEQRKLDYIHPGEQLKEYANELGIKLVQPYSAPDEGAEKISGLMDEAQKKDTLIKEQGKEVSELRTQVSTLSDQVSQLIETFKQPKPELPVELGEGSLPSEDSIIDWDEKREKEMLRFRTLNKASFKAWMKKNWVNASHYPEEIKNEIQARHVDLLGVPIPDDFPRYEK